MILHVTFVSTQLIIVNVISWEAKTNPCFYHFELCGNMYKCCIRYELNFMNLSSWMSRKKYVEYNPSARTPPLRDDFNADPGRLVEAGNNAEHRVWLP